MQEKLKLGRIHFLNVLPLYYPLEKQIVKHDYEIIPATPAELNQMMANGELHLSATSSFEFAKNAERYFVIDNLSISSTGPVLSVELFSQLPVEQLANQEILLTSQSHTSVNLLKLLFADYYQIPVKFYTQSLKEVMSGAKKPVAFLAIGDQALYLRKKNEYPYCLDLAEIWREWTKLPFVFALWIVGKNFVEAKLFKEEPGLILRAARDWALANLEQVLDNGIKEYLTESHLAECPLDRQGLEFYYRQALDFKLGEAELAGLNLFYEKLAMKGMIKNKPELCFSSQVF